MSSDELKFSRRASAVTGVEERQQWTDQNIIRVAPQAIVETKEPGTSTPLSKLSIMTPTCSENGTLSCDAFGTMPERLRASVEWQPWNPLS